MLTVTAVASAACPEGTKQAYKGCEPIFSAPVGTGEVLYRDFEDQKDVDGERKWFKEGDENTHVKYIGGVKDGLPHGVGMDSFGGGSM